MRYLAILLFAVMAIGLTVCGCLLWQKREADTPRGQLFEPLPADVCPLGSDAHPRHLWRCDLYTPAFDRRGMAAHRSGRCSVPPFGIGSMAVLWLPALQGALSLGGNLYRPGISPPLCQCALPDGLVADSRSAHPFLRAVPLARRGVDAVLLRHYLVQTT